MPRQAPEQVELALCNALEVKVEAASSAQIVGVAVGKVFSQDVAGERLGE